MTTKNLHAERKAALSLVASETEALEEAKAERLAVLEAQAIAQGLATKLQQKAHGQIAHIVTQALAAVFDDPYEFQINFVERRGKTDAHLVFVRDGMEVDPLSQAGGGVVDVAAFALRVACLMLSQPPLRRVLFFDEPFRFVSDGYRERVRDMVETFSRELGIQFIFVTHIEELKIGEVIELTKNIPISHFQE